MADEVQQFIEDNDLSHKVAGLLRSCSPLVQRVVLDQGSLATCRDPNAGCVGRIRKAEKSASSTFVAPSRDEVETFIEENELNERAGEALRGAAPAVQRQVLEQGSLLSCREPSAGCIGRINKAQKTMDPALLAIPHISGPSVEELEDFIHDNSLDERAASALRTAAQWLQRQVLDQGSLHTCRDPNAGLMGRIRRARQPSQFSVQQASVPPRKEVFNAFPGQTAPTARDTRPCYDIERFIEENCLNERAADALRSADSPVQQQVLDQGSLHGTREPSAACIGRISKIQRKARKRGWGSPSLDDVESFIYENRLDQRAAAALERAPPVVQRSLLSQGQLHGNTSRECMAQIRAATSQEQYGAEPLDEVEQFISDNGVDTFAASKLREAHPDVQRWVLDQGSLSTCREPSAGCVGRIRKAEVALQEVSLPDHGNGALPPDEVERFIEENRLNERAAEALRGILPEVQMEVMSQGSLATCREPSAGCIGRIAKAQAAFKQQPPARLTLTPAPNIEDGDVEQFIVENDLSERAAEVLRSVPRQIQEQVLEQGPLRGCREPSASCIGRISKAQKSTRMNWSAEGPSAKELEAFIHDNSLSDRAVSILHEVPAMVQRAVLDQGSMRGCRDASAGCIGRIKKAQQALKDGTLEPRSGQRGTKRPYEEAPVRPDRGLRRQVDGFIREHDLSDRAASVLREQQPEVQEIVLRGGSLRGTRDMSASCMGRIRKAQQEVAERSSRPSKRSRNSGSLSQVVRAVGSNLDQRDRDRGRGLQSGR
ncbi:unnamed protein product [Durusdinium trenchii]|uniref:Uncharacterized protein n=1 Tax=Durusdinium trenchii TaxID=1381693 RepID=A0ABP0PLK5_9DINO